MRSFLKRFKIKLAIWEIIWLCLLCFLAKGSDGHVLVYQVENNQLLDEYYDLPAQFSPNIPTNGLRVYVIRISPTYGCEKMTPPPKDLYPRKSMFAAIIERGHNCTFENKVRNAQDAHYDVAIVYNNDGDDLEQMSANNSSGIHIYSIFVGETTGLSLRKFNNDRIIVVITDELPFNINTQLILPFAILIGLCFLAMIGYMIFKCIRQERRLRRYRLPKRLLKKLPILKYTKNSDLSYDVCVICLDEFVEGDKLRVLPCKHPYHSHCIDPWLTENRRVCPICKRKVFTKGEVRPVRNQQSPLDSISDTDDDTTPLLQPNNNSNDTSGRNASAATQISPTATPTAPPANTTQHGTFRRTHGAEPIEHSDANEYSTALSSAEVLTSDDESALVSPVHSSRRVNPFNRSSNLSTPLAQPLRVNVTSLFNNIASFFRRRQSVSVVAPPFVDAALLNTRVTASPLRNMTSILSTAIAIDDSTQSSNNILNPNLSGSFKDDDEFMPHQSIYEPIVPVTPVGNNPTVMPQNPTIGFDATNLLSGTNTAFIQTPTLGGIGVVALPNTNIQHDALSSRSNRRFLI